MCIGHSQPDGFDSGVSTEGSFSHLFTAPGTFYYKSIGGSSSSLRGTVTARISKVEDGSMYIGSNITSGNAIKAREMILEGSSDQGSVRIEGSHVLVSATGGVMIDGSVNAASVLANGVDIAGGRIVGGYEKPELWYSSEWGPCTQYAYYWGEVSTEYQPELNATVGNGCLAGAMPVRVGKAYFHNHLMMCGAYAYFWLCITS
jgi:hypothetical protein